MGIFDIFLPNNAIFSQKIAQNWRFFPKNRLSHTILQNAPKTTYTTPNPTLYMWDRRLPMLSPEYFFVHIPPVIFGTVHMCMS